MRAGIWSSTLFVGLTALLASGCGDDKTAPKIEEITGAWQASKVEYTHTTMPITVDVIAGGGSGTLILDDSGTFTWVLTPAGKPQEVKQGTWVMTSDVMTFTETGMPFSMQFDLHYSGNTLNLLGADAEFDFNEDGTGENAKLSLYLTR